VAGLTLGATACVKPFYHSNTTLQICGDLGWDNSLCGASLCSDYYHAYPGETCPDELRYGTGVR